MDTRLPGIKPFRNIIFDLDGTLVDSVRLTCAIIDAMLADRGLTDTADRALARSMDARGGTAMITAVLGPHCGDPQGELAEFRSRHAVFATPDDLAFPGVPETLRGLAAAGIGMAICSNKPQALCEKILGDLGLSRYFSAIIGSRCDLPKKPAPDAVRLALEALGADVASALYVGDSMIDVATARAADLPVALVPWGYGVTEARQTDPTLTLLNSFDHLLDNAACHDASWCETGYPR